ncbi:hypothetical protein LEMA_P061430.1 [Plenodomus lingam JN3]|uniref:F-BAR domain-containing protein n=1 Tax=Leptosphaeria maculans (strain JN3 / isolate v23.1.3 / race Av1-4-5-6-7-8) TaxID=985895 RepID=E4ZIT8_LEPMJ|nr:hypothetical protein LEMA_P061430.1 [Plenodomus lingam JN3]CBX91109.1 hypothetical protein LEMA_P061430.1 [Plenodomus lingam JN3]
MGGAAAMEPPSVSLSFANNFWGKDDAGVGPMLDRMHAAKVTNDELKNFYAARAAIEEEYSRKLLNLSRKPLGSCETGTLRLSCDVIKAEVESMGKAHQSIAQQMKTELEEPLAAFAGGMKERRKIVQNGIEKLLKLKMQQTATVNKARDRYEQDCLKIKGFLAQAHMVMGHEERKNKARLEKTQINLSTTSAEYEAAVKVLEETTGRWNRDWKAACDKFQDLEEERIDYTKSSLWNFANIASTVCVSDDASCEKIRLSLEDCDVEKDISNFIAESGTGQEIPDPPKFINFCRGDAETSSQASEDENYSVAQFARTMNPAYRASSPQPSVFESHHDPNNPLARELGLQRDTKPVPQDQINMAPQQDQIDVPSRQAAETPQPIQAPQPVDYAQPVRQAEPIRTRREVQPIQTQQPMQSHRDMYQTQSPRDMHQSQSPRDVQHAPSPRDMHPMHSPQDMHQIQPPRDMHYAQSPRDIHQTQSRDMHQTQSSRDMHQTQSSRDMQPIQSPPDVQPLQSQRDMHPVQSQREVQSMRPQRERAYSQREMQPPPLQREMPPPQSPREIQPLQSQRNVQPPQSQRAVQPDPRLVQAQEQARQNYQQSQIPHNDYPADGMTQFCRIGPPSDRSTIPSPARPVSRDSQSDYSNPTSFESIEPPSGSASPGKPMPQSSFAEPGPSTPVEETAVAKKRGFFNSPFARRKSRQEEKPPVLTPTSRNTWGPTRRQTEENVSPTKSAYGRGTRGTMRQDAPRSASPEPVDPRANFQLNVGNNVFDVASPDKKKLEQNEKEPEGELDPIAQALEELKGVTKQPTGRQTADRYLGLATPAPPATPAVGASLPGSAPTPLANVALSAAKRGTPPPYEQPPMSRLGAPKPAHTARQMQKTTQMYVSQKANMFNGGESARSSSRSPTKQEPPRVASPQPPRAVSPRPSLQPTQNSYRSTQQQPASSSSSSSRKLHHHSDSKLPRHNSASSQHHSNNSVHRTFASDAN